MTEDRGDYTRASPAPSLLPPPSRRDCGRSPCISVKCAVSVEAVSPLKSGILLSYRRGHPGAEKANEDSPRFADSWFDRVGSGGVAGGRAGHRRGARGGGPFGRRQGLHRTGGSPVRGAGAAGEHAEARGRAPARAPGAGDLARRAGQGVRQPLLRRRKGIFGLGGRHLGRHHHHRPDLRLLGRGRGDRRVAQARPRSGPDQVRPREPRTLRSRRRGRVPAGQLQRARRDFRGRLGAAGARHRIVAQAEEATWWPPTARS